MQFITALTLLIGAASATSFQAWSGDQCNGDAGSKVTLHSGGSCEEIGGRHSFTVRGDHWKAVYYEKGGCNQSGRSSSATGNPDTCYNINTGFGVGSVCIGGMSA